MPPLRRPGNTLLCYAMLHQLYRPASGSNTTFIQLKQTANTSPDVSQHKKPCSSQSSANSAKLGTYAKKEQAKVKVKVKVKVEMHKRNTQLAKYSRSLIQRATPGGQRNDVALMSNIVQRNGQQKVGRNRGKHLSTCGAVVEPTTNAHLSNTGKLLNDKG